MQVNLHGRTQRQQEDDLWYTCIAHIRVVGIPIYNYVPQHIASHPISRQSTEENLLELSTQSSPSVDEGVDADCAQSAAGDGPLSPCSIPCIIAPVMGPHVPLISLGKPPSALFVGDAQLHWYPAICVPLAYQMYAQQSWCSHAEDPVRLPFCMLPCCPTCPQLQQADSCCIAQAFQASRVQW